MKNYKRLCNIAGINLKVEFYGIGEPQGSKSEFAVEKGNRLKIIIDMNLSPEWIEYLESYGHEVFHWKDFGNPNAKDVEIIDWARVNSSRVFILVSLNQASRTNM